MFIAFAILNQIFSSRRVHSIQANTNSNSNYIYKKAENTQEIENNKKMSGLNGNSSENAAVV